MKLALPVFPRPGKTTVVLGFAIVVGGIAALAANRFLAARIDAIEARNRSETVEVVVARVDLPKGVKVQAGNVALRAVPKSYAHSNALTNDSFGVAVGRKLAYDIKGGEMLMLGLLESSRPPTFSARISAGRRAMTVAVDEINSISGLLEPGDIVDLIAGLERKGKKLTVPLLQSVQVMATGQRVVDDPATGERRQYATVTLNVTPYQATALIAARDGGKITALLRNPVDQFDASADAMDINALLGEGHEEGTGVPVLYGGSSGRLAPEALMLDIYKEGAAAPAMAAINAMRAAAPSANAANAASAASAASASSSAAAVPVLSPTAPDGEPAAAGAMKAVHSPAGSPAAASGTGRAAGPR